VIPEDPHLRECSLDGKPVVLEHPTSPASVAIINLAARLLGVPAPMPVEKKKEGGLLDALFGLFRKKHSPDLKQLEADKKMVLAKKS
jgi:septum site-determining protein MinD